MPCDPCGLILQADGTYAIDESQNATPTNYYSNFSGDDTPTINARIADWQGEWFVLNKILNKSDVNWYGGLMKGSFSETTSWSRMHDAYAMVIERAPNCTLQKIRIHNTGDGFSVNEGCDGWIIEGCHVSIARD